MTTHQQILDDYARPGPLTVAGRRADDIRQLPTRLPELVGAIQGLVIHQHVAEPFYGTTFSPERLDHDANLRSLEDIVHAILALDDQPLTVARPPERRLAGVCHDFAVLLVGCLRARGIPARSRYGFGAYFRPGFHEDHSLCEYWSSDDQRWVLVDPQFDDVWRERLHIEHDVLDVPRDQFLVASDAWTRCRRGELDPDRVGTFNGDLHGLWFVAGSLVRDLAALSKIEMLQWDVWGAMPQPGDPTQLALFDQIATVTRDPDVTFKPLQALYRHESLQVAGEVFNALRKRSETVDLQRARDAQPAVRLPARSAFHRQ